MERILVITECVCETSSKFNDLLNFYELLKRENDYPTVDLIQIKTFKGRAIYLNIMSFDDSVNAGDVVLYSKLIHINISSVFVPINISF